MTTVLVVDDSADERAALVALLAQHYRTLEAWDGAEAIHLIRAERPDVVVADLLMPEVDGFELIRRVRADRDLAATPVILCTAYQLRREAVQRLREYGATLIAKSGAATTLLDAVTGHLTRKTG